MDNCTSSAIPAIFTPADEIHILPFYTTDGDKSITFSIFALLYLTGLLMNTTIVTVISLNAYLHTPMYVFICILACVDMAYVTVTVPKLLNMLLSGNNTVTVSQCFTQMYFFFLVGVSEIFLLLTMAYDRFVAICKPLHYHSIMSKKTCSLFMAAILMCASLHSLLVTTSAANMSFCHSNTIYHFYCDAKALSNIACCGKELFYTVVLIEMLQIGLLPFVCNMVSYTKILKVMLMIKSTDGRRKAFSTCSSHFISIIIFYSTGTMVYMIPSQHKTLEQLFTVLYAVVTPMLNPLIYSLKNKDIKLAAVKLLNKTLNSVRWH